MASPLALALMQGQGAAGVPQPYTAQVAPTNFTQANSDYNNAMSQSYAAQLGQQNALWGGLAGLGSAGILVAPKLMGSGAGAAGGASLLGNASGGTAALPLAGLDASDYGAGASLLDQFGLGSGSIAAADAGAGAAADAGATAAAGGSSDVLASLLALLPFA
jgi:hypothetical protein